jgi:branched-chain amino acid aminotransferase
MINVTRPSNPSMAETTLKGELTFGRTFADLMVTIHHDPERGWHDAKVVPFGPLALSPAAKSLHYGLEIFEGHKAFAQPNGDAALFRPELNARRLNVSASRMSMPTIPEEMQLDAIHTLVDAIRAWVPRDGGALYLRPAIIGTEGTIGVAPSTSHLYFIIASPVTAYFSGPLRAIAVKVEANGTRAAKGGVGFAKTGGNYAASMANKKAALNEGFDEVLWLDSKDHRYLEELCAMNVIMLKHQRLVTPPVSETILDGITRRSIITIAKDLGIAVEERPVSIDEVESGIASGVVEEMMAVGTAAAVTPIGRISVNGRAFTIRDGKPGPTTLQLLEALTGIQFGRIPDKYGWMQTVERRVVPSYLDKASASA